MLKQSTQGHGTTETQLELYSPAMSNLPDSVKVSKGKQAANKNGSTKRKAVQGISICHQNQNDVSMTGAMRAVAERGMG